MYRIALLTIAFLFQAACVSQMPLVSHAHMGHSLTTWHDTPGQEGLFAVARQETSIALSEAVLAYQTMAEPHRSRQHIENVIHALNADMQPVGTGLGYGAIRAMTGAIDHLEFAAASEDASDNMIKSAMTISALGDEIVQGLEHALSLAKALQGGTTETPIDVHGELLTLLHQLVIDEATDVTAPSLTRFDHELQAMLARETDPPYEPVARRYVLGLVKLPNGLWGFRLPRRQGVDHSRHTSYQMPGY